MIYLPPFNRTRKIYDSFPVSNLNITQTKVMLNLWDWMLADPEEGIVDEKVLQLWHLLANGVRMSWDCSATKVKIFIFALTEIFIKNPVHKDPS